MASKLVDICSYAKGKTAVAGLTAQNYISTENMLPNKGGITTAANLPSVGQTQAYRKNDVLVSNIRPYFKKIWHADCDGGCSNDVLVFRAADCVDPAFLYYVLADDNFFNYATATSKGTKMPRGDKGAIMEYDVPTLDIGAQRKIGALLRSIDQKIVVNSKINDNLHDLLQSVYQLQFGLTSGNSAVGTLSEICSYTQNRIAVSELSVGNYYSTENMLPGKAGFTEATSLPTTPQTTRCSAGDVLVSNIRPYFKKIVYCHSEGGCSTDVLCFAPKTPAYSAYLFCTLYADRFFDFMVAGSKGTKMPRGDKQQIMTYPICIPTDFELKAFDDFAVPILCQIHNNRSENARLAMLRDTLLPKLMSGEIDVSDIQF